MNLLKDPTFNFFAMIASVTAIEFAVIFLMILFSKLFTRLKRIFKHE